MQSRSIHNGVYVLDEVRLVDTLHGLWGNGTASQGVHDNDKVRLFGILMSLQKNRLLLQRLAECATERSTIGDPELSINGIFTQLCFDFNNDDIIIELPSNACDVEGVENLDPNNMNRITIQRDCK